MNTLPLAVVMISLNEEHNMREVLENISGWASEIFLVDSFSSDATVDIALKFGVHVVQRRFQGFGDQWNFALENLPISAPWTMKIDPDERLSDELKTEIQKAIKFDEADALMFKRQWWLFGKPLSISDNVLRIWRTGHCRFSDVSVNEHPVVQGNQVFIKGTLLHLDSPDLDHWFNKQNKYSTAEALNLYFDRPTAVAPKFFGRSDERRAWLKKNFFKIPFRYLILFLYYWLWRGAWKFGWVGYTSARLWTDVMRLTEYKYREMKLRRHAYSARKFSIGKPHPTVEQFD